MPNTLTQIDARVVLNLAVSSDSTTYSQARRWSKINSVIKRICDWKIVDLLMQEKWQDKIITWWDLRFLRKRVQIIDQAPLVLQDAEITSATTTINTSSTTNVPTAWNWYIGGSIFAYTGKTATTLTWVTGIEWTHTKWAQIKIVTKLPTDCARPFELLVVDVDWSLKPTTHIDYKSQDYAENYRTIVWDATVANQYVYMNFFDQQNVYRLYYFKNPTTLASWATETEIPDTYGEDLVAILASWELLRETEKRDQWRNQLVLAYSALLEFYDKFIEQKREFRQAVRNKPSKHWFVYQRQYRW